MARHLSRKTPCDDVITESLEPSESLNSDKITPISIVIHEEKAHHIPTIYACQHCKKTFRKKDHYTNHINRQDPCVNMYSGIYKILRTKKSVPLNVIDLFCGCGGFAKGFTNAGLNVVAGIDFWKVAIDSYSSNYNHLSLCVDLKEFPPEVLLRQHIGSKIGLNIDIIIGGPPCQGFSTMGNRDPNDPRNSLFMEFVKYVYFFLPSAFVIENVTGILTMKTSSGENVIDIIINHLNPSYNCKIFKVSASDYDVPQERKRIIIMGIRKNRSIEPSLPLETSKYNKIPVKIVLLDEDEVDAKYYLSQPIVDKITSGKKTYGVKFIDINKPCNTILAGYGKSGGYTSLVKYSDTKIRKLIPLELGSIQTFPDDYIFKGTENDIIKQIGNAVPCNLAYHIAKHLSELLL